MDGNKKFGLILSKKSNQVNIRSNSIFDSDSDEEKSVNKRPKIPQKKIDPKKGIKAELSEDPSIYEYDSIYDDMKAKEIESIAPKKKENSRYINTLLKAADKRKKEYERRVEKKIQVEREKEGDKYKDKESYVTSAYKKKMQEMEEEEERERRENLINDMMDVTKQKDLSGFYRHFLNQTIGEEKIPTFGEDRLKQEVVSIKVEETSPVHNKVEDLNFSAGCSNVDRDSDGIEIDSDSSSDDDMKFKEKYPEHHSSNSSSDNDRQNNQLQYKSQKSYVKTQRKYRSNKNSDAKDNESSPTSESDDNGKECALEDKIDKNKKIEKGSETKTKETHVNYDSKSKEPKISEKSDKKEFNKQNKYIKRTVGDVFSAAQARYFQRLANCNGIS